MAGRSRATVAEFHKDSGGRLRLFALTMIEDHGEYLYRTIYDVEHSRKYGYLFNMSGGGGSGQTPVSGIYFTTGDVAVKEGPCQLVDSKDRPPWRSKKTKTIRARNRTRRLKRLPKAFALEAGEDILDWLHANAIEGDAVWCAICRDHLPEDSQCEHIWWCEAGGWWSTPSDRCECKNRTQCGKWA